LTKYIAGVFGCCSGVDIDPAKPNPISRACPSPGQAFFVRWTGFITVEMQKAFKSTCFVRGDAGEQQFVEF
jgi:hypothetical protein